MQVIRAESVGRQRSDDPAGSATGVLGGRVDGSAVASVVASLRDRFEESRRAAAAAATAPRDPDAAAGTAPAAAAAAVAPAAGKPDVPPKPGRDGGGRVGRRVQRQPAFREFDVVNAGRSTEFKEPAT